MTRTEFIRGALHLMMCVGFGLGVWLLASDERILVFLGGFIVAAHGAWIIRAAVEMGIKDARR